MAWEAKGGAKVAARACPSGRSRHQAAPSCFSRHQTPLSLVLWTAKSRWGKVEARESLVVGARGEGTPRTNSACPQLCLWSENNPWALEEARESPVVGARGEDKQRTN